MTRQNLQNANIEIDDLGFIRVNTTASIGNSANSVPFGAVTIASGASQSSQIACKGARGVTVETPSIWTDADIGFEVSQDAVNWSPVYTESARAKITGVATAQRNVYTAPGALWVVQVYNFLRIASLNTVGGALRNQAQITNLNIGLLF